MIKSLKIQIFLSIIFVIVSCKQIPISNIFPDRGPLSGNTRVVIFSPSFSKLNKALYPNPKVCFQKNIY